MAGNRKFHNKFHSANHHTLPTPHIKDSGLDPIASHPFPFIGDFVMNGVLSASNNYTLNNGNRRSNNLDTIQHGLPAPLGWNVLRDSTYIDGDVTITGNLSAYGELTYLHTQVHTTSSTEVVVMSNNSNGKSTGFLVDQHGTNDIMHIKNDGNSSLLMTGASGNPGWIGINLASLSAEGITKPNQRMTIVGSVSVVPDPYELADQNNQTDPGTSGSLYIEGDLHVNDNTYLDQVTVDTTDGEFYVSGSGSPGFENRFDVDVPTHLDRTHIDTSDGDFVVSGSNTIDVDVPGDFDAHVNLDSTHIDTSDGNFVVSGSNTMDVDVPADFERHVQMDQVTIDTTDGKTLILGPNEVDIDTDVDIDGHTRLDQVTIDTNDGDFVVSGTSIVDVSSDLYVDILTVDTNHGKTTIAGIQPLDVSAPTLLDQLTVDTDGGSMVVSGSNPVDISANTYLDQLVVDTTTGDMTVSGTGFMYVKSFALIDTTQVGDLHVTNTAVFDPAVHVHIKGDLTVDGNVTLKADAAGNITIGDADSDNVIFRGDVKSHIIPDITKTYNLGSSEKKWNTVYTDNLSADGVTVDGAEIAGDIDVKGTAHLDRTSIDTSSGDFAVSGTGSSKFFTPTTFYNEMSALGGPWKFGACGSSYDAGSVNPLDQTIGSVVNDAHLALPHPFEVECNSLFHHGLTARGPVKIGPVPTPHTDNLLLPTFEIVGNAKVESGHLHLRSDIRHIDNETTLIHFDTNAIELVADDVRFLTLTNENSAVGNDHLQIGQPFNPVDVKMYKGREPLKPAFHLESTRGNIGIGGENEAYDVIGDGVDIQGSLRVTHTLSARDLIVDNITVLDNSTGIVGGHGGGSLTSLSGTALKGATAQEWVNGETQTISGTETGIVIDATEGPASSQSLYSFSFKALSADSALGVEVGDTETITYQLAVRWDEYYTQAFVNDVEYGIVHTSDESFVNLTSVVLSATSVPTSERIIKIIVDPKVDVEYFAHNVLVQEKPEELEAFRYGDTRIVGTLATNTLSADLGDFEDTETNNLRVFEAAIVDGNVQAGSLSVLSGADITGDSKVDGDLHVTGNFRVDGNAWLSAGASGVINVGDTNTDNVVFNADVDSNIVPDDDVTYMLGSLDKRWLTLNVENVSAAGIGHFGGTLTVDGNVDIQDNLTVGGVTTFIGGVSSEELSGNSITAGELNVNGESAFGGNSVFDSDVHVKGNLRVDGNAYLSAGSSGVINVGDTADDLIVFNADVDSNIVPDKNETYNLGSLSHHWLKTFTHDLWAHDSITAEGHIQSGSLSVVGTSTLSGSVDILASLTTTGGISGEGGLVISNSDTNLGGNVIIGDPGQANALTMNACVSGDLIPCLGSSGHRSAIYEWGGSYDNYAIDRQLGDFSFDGDEATGFSMTSQFAPGDVSLDLFDLQAGDVVDLLLWRNTASLNILWNGVEIPLSSSLGGGASQWKTVTAVEGTNTITFQQRTTLAYSDAQKLYQVKVNGMILLTSGTEADGYKLGSDTHRWSEIWVNSAEVSGKVTADSLDVQNAIQAKTATFTNPGSVGLSVSGGSNLLGDINTGGDIILNGFKIEQSAGGLGSDDWSSSYNFINTTSGEWGYATLSAYENNRLVLRHDQVPDLAITRVHRVTNSSLVETLDNVLRGDIVLVNDTEDNLIAIVDLPAGTYDTAGAEYVGYEKLFAPGNMVRFINGYQGPSVTLNPDDLDDSDTDHKFISQAELDTLASVDTTVNTFSGDWNDARATLMSASGDWESTHASVFATSSDWDSVYTWVNSDSATNNSQYNQSTYINASGDTVTGDLIVDQFLGTVNLDVSTDATTNNLSAHRIKTTNEIESASVNTGTINANYAVFTSMTAVSSFIDVVDIKVRELSGFDLIDGDLTVQGDVSASGDVYLNKNSLIFSDSEHFNSQDSKDAKSVYSSVLTTSASWNSVYTSSNATSSNWDSTHASVLATSGDWNDARSTLASTSGDWNDARSTLASTSGDWNDARTTLAGTSADWDSVYLTTKTNSAWWDDNAADITAIATTSANWDSVYTHINTSSGAGGFATLVNGRLDESQVPNLSITETYVVFNNSQVETLCDGTLQGAIDIEKGDVVIITETEENLIAVTNNPTGVYDPQFDTFDGFSKLVTPTDYIKTLNGKQGLAVTINPDDMDDSVTAHKFVSQPDINNWDSLYGTIFNLSGGWDSIYTSVNSTSGSWNSVYSTVHDASGTWMSSEGGTIDGDLHVTGDLRVDGSAYLSAGVNGVINVGDTNTDNIVFHGEIDSNILPDKNMTYDLGSQSQHWMKIFTHDLWAHGNIEVVGDSDFTGVTTLSGKRASGPGVIIKGTPTGLFDVNTPGFEDREGDYMIPDVDITGDVALHGSLSADNAHIYSLTASNFKAEYQRLVINDGDLEVLNGDIRQRGGNVYVDRDIAHIDDDFTYIRFEPKQIELTVDDTPVLQLKGHSTLPGGATEGVIVGNAQDVVSFEIENPTDPYTFVVDPVKAYIGIGTDAPQEKFHMHSGAMQLASGAQGGALYLPSGDNSTRSDKVGSIRWNTEENFYEGWAPDHQRWVKFHEPTDRQDPDNNTYISFDAGAYDNSDVIGLYTVGCSAMTIGPDQKVTFSGDIEFDNITIYDNNSVTGPLSATTEFIYLKVNGKDRAIRLWATPEDTRTGLRTIHGEKIHHIADDDCNATAIQTISANTGLLAE